MSKVRHPNYFSADEQFTKLAARFQKESSEDLFDRERWTSMVCIFGFNIIFGFFVTTSMTSTQPPLLEISRFVRVILAQGPC